MPEQNVSVEIAKISYKQAVMVALIALVGGLLTAVAKPSAIANTQRFVVEMIGGTGAPKADVIPAASAETVALRRQIADVSRDKRELETDFAAAQAQIAQLQLESGSADGDLRALRREARMARNAAAAAQAEADRLKRQLQDAKEKLGEHEWRIEAEFRPALFSSLLSTDPMTCVDRAEQSVKAAGGVVTRRDGNAVFSHNGQYNWTVQCIPSAQLAMIVTAGPDGPTANDWGMKLRKAFSGR